MVLHLGGVIALLEIPEQVYNDQKYTLSVMNHLPFFQANSEKFWYFHCFGFCLLESGAGGKEPKVTSTTRATFSQHSLTHYFNP
jgi:hypothetical protein